MSDDLEHYDKVITLEELQWINKIVENSTKVGLKIRYFVKRNNDDLECKFQRVILGED